MRELNEIISAFDGLVAERRSSALVTLISVKGSAYRRAGARMLVTVDGRTWGGVSGGCLEHDVSRRARMAIDLGVSMRHVYHTAADDEEGPVTPGQSTGCGGTIEVFIQPIDQERPGPLQLLRRCTRGRESLTICTPIRAGWGRAHPSIELDALDDRFPTSVQQVARSITRSGKASTRLVIEEDGSDWLVERLVPPLELFVFGSGQDVLPLVALVKLLGWRVSVIASRSHGRLRERFAAADALHVVPSVDLGSFATTISRDAAVAVMTHDVVRDQAILAALRGPLRYVGLLGPRHRTRRIFSNLPSRQLCGVDPADFFNPIGLALGGSSTPEEIALSIAAEIQMTLSGAAGGSLRDNVDRSARCGFASASAVELPMQCPSNAACPA